MANLTIYNIPDDLLKKLERSANENRRAVDEEAIIWLSQIEAPELPDKSPAKQTIEELRAFRKSIPHVYATEEDLNNAKREGRLGDIKDDPYRIIPSRFTSPMKPEEFIEYTQRLSRKLEGNVWATEEEVNRAKSEGRL